MILDYTLHQDDTNRVIHEDTLEDLYIYAVNDIMLEYIPH